MRNKSIAAIILLYPSFYRNFVYIAHLLRVKAVILYLLLREFNIKCLAKQVLLPKKRRNDVNSFMRWQEFLKNIQSEVLCRAPLLNDHHAYCVGFIDKTLLKQESDGC